MPYRFTVWHRGGRDERAAARRRERYDRHVVIPIGVLVVWVASAGLFFASGRPVAAGVSLALAPMALVLTLHARRVLHRRAAGAVSRRAAARGVSVRDEVEHIRAHENGEVAADTDLVPNWPFAVIGLLALGSLGALIVSIVS